MRSYDVHRWKNDSGCYDSKRKGLLTISFSSHLEGLCTPRKSTRLSCDHAGSDPSQHKVKLGYAQTYLDDKRLAMDIHFLLSLCRQSRRFYSKLKYLLIPWTGSAKSIRGSPMQNEVKRGHRPFQLCRGKIWTLWRLMQNRKRSLDKNKAFRRIRQQLGCSTSAIHRKQKCIYPCMPRWVPW